VGPSALPSAVWVIDDVENYLDSGAMERLDEIAEFIDGAERLLPRTVGGMGSEK